MMTIKPKLMSLDEYWNTFETSLLAAGYPPEKLAETKSAYYAGACTILLGALHNAARVPKPEGQAYIEGLMNEATEVQREMSARLFNKVFGMGEQS